MAKKKQVVGNKKAPLTDIEEAHAAYGFGPKDAPAARVGLLGWWDRGHRVMPWRRETNGDDLTAEDRRLWAYRVWVSEVMLQQTQVDRVVPYFNSWLTRWPTVGALSRADIDEVRALWSGLGYYRRCAFLLEGAKQLSLQGTTFPTTRDEWLKVKGVGAYTAAAIASIVFGERVPVVDGNVIRVLSRLRACDVQPAGRVGSKLWWLLAAEVVNDDCDRPGDVNQAMMELGATVCTKANPNCGECPLASVCRAKVDLSSREIASRFPAATAKKPATRVFAVVCVLEFRAQFLMVKPGAVFGIEGLWELPGTRLTEEQAADPALVKKSVLDIGITTEILLLEKPIAHTITSSKYSVQVCHCRVTGDPTLLMQTKSCLVTRADLATKGASSFVAKALTAVFSPKEEKNNKKPVTAAAAAAAAAPKKKRQQKKPVQGPGLSSSSAPPAPSSPKSNKRTRIT